MGNLNSIKELKNKMCHSGYFLGDERQSDSIIRHYLLGMPSVSAPKEIFHKIFSQNYEPGTFSIAERKSNPPFICVEEQLGFDDWLISEVENDLQKITPALKDKFQGVLPDESYIEKIPGMVLDLFNYNFNGRCAFAQEVYQQEYTDVLRKANLIYLTGLHRIPFTEYDALFDYMLPVGLKIAGKLDRFDISTLLRISAASGLVGLNHKSNSTATAILYNQNILPLDIHLSPDDSADSIFKGLLEKAKNGWAIEYEKEFFERLLENKKPQLLVFFTDDFFESIVDLKLMEKLLASNTQLKIVVIPRAFRMGNDAGFADINMLLQSNVFRMSSYISTGRLFIEPNGPLSGNFNGLRVSLSVSMHLLSADVIFAKGARSFECMQGLNCHLFFSFAVCRNLSESATGINGETGGLVLIYQKPWAYSFEGFRKRHKRKILSPNKRNIWLAAKTALEIKKRG